MKRIVLILLLIPLLLIFCSCEEEIKYDNICKSIAISKTPYGITVSVNANPVEKEGQLQSFEFTGKDVKEAFSKMFTELDKTIFKSCDTLSLPQYVSNAEMADILSYIANESRIQLNCSTDTKLSFIEYYRKFFSENKNGF